MVQGQELIDSSQRFCTSCGKGVSQDFSYCPYCGQRAAGEPSYCSHCGGSISVGVRFCLTCGTAVGAEAVQTSHAEAILGKLARAMELTGLDSRPTDTPEFIRAYVQEVSGWEIRASIFFLVSVLDAGRAEPSDVDRLIQRGKQWCKQRTGAIPFLHNPSLNLVLLHDGQLPKGFIKGKLDKSGLYRVMLASITLIDVVGEVIEQEKSWALQGTAREAVHRASMIL